MHGSSGREGEGSKGEGGEGIEGWYRFAYSHFAYSHFAYLQPQRDVLPTQAAFGGLYYLRARVQNHYNGLFIALVGQLVPVAQRFSAVACTVDFSSLRICVTMSVRAWRESHNVFQLDHARTALIHARSWSRKFEVS